MLSRFFLSSRRRHTRLQGDWSSDVCSADLSRSSPSASAASSTRKGRFGRAGMRAPICAASSLPATRRAPFNGSSSLHRKARSEERRVGKEGRRRRRKGKDKVKKKHKRESTR